MSSPGIETLSFNKAITANKKNAIILSVGYKFSETKEEYVTQAFFAVMRDGLEVDEVRADDVRVHWVVVTQLDLDALAQRRKHLREHDLLVPRRRVAVLLY